MVYFDTYEALYKRFANKNINVLSATQFADGTICIEVEYLYNRPKDDKMIWPKIMTLGPTLEEAIYKAEQIVDEIRG